MKELSGANFGVVIAFLLPGFLALWGLSLTSPTVASWMTVATSAAGPTVGGFLYATLASLALGLLLSAVRWLTIDHLLAILGTKQPNLDFSTLSDKDRYTAFLGVVENHYRFYQYYSNTFVGSVSAVILYLKAGTPALSILGWIVVGFIHLALFLGARDALSKYYKRSEAILGTTP